MTKWIYFGNAKLFEHSNSLIEFIILTEEEKSYDCFYKIQRLVTFLKT